MFRNKKNRDTQKILFLGPKFNKTDPAVSGGGAVLFEELVSQTRNYGLEYEVIDTNGSNYTNRSIAFFLFVWKFLLNLPQCWHVSLHGTAKDYILLAPIIVLFSKLFGKDVSLRKFAGNFDEIYEKSNMLTRFLIRYILRYSDTNFFETKYLMDYFKKYNQHTYYLPNTRPRPSVNKSGKIFAKRFVYMGHIRKEKGIVELLEASNLLDEAYVIDMYGSLFQHMQNMGFEKYRANYKGPLKPDEVISKMSEYDVLLLPSYREGYPGVIIEALSLGMPVVATNLKGIKEMVDDKSSILIDPGNIEQLKEAIESFDEINYTERSAAALKQFENFDSKTQFELFFKIIMGKREDKS